MKQFAPRPAAPNQDEDLAAALKELVALVGRKAAYERLDVDRTVLDRALLGGRLRRGSVVLLRTALERYLARHQAVAA